MTQDDDEDLRVIALDHAVKATASEYTGTPPAEEIVARAQTYFEFLRGDAEKKAEDGA